VQLVTKQEKLVLKFLLAALTLGVLATVYKNTLLEPGSIPKEVKQQRYLNRTQILDY
jgi:hypothetical protein